jgi:hypothetical protein
MTTTYSVDVSNLINFSARIRGAVSTLLSSVAAKRDGEANAAASDALNVASGTVNVAVIDHEAEVVEAEAVLWQIYCRREWPCLTQH